MADQTLFLDIENDGDRLLTVQWAIDEGDVVVTDGSLWPAPGTPPEQTQFAVLPALIAAKDVVKVTQSDHDLRWFIMHGHKVGGPWHDTMVMAWVHDENQPLDQASLLKRYADHVSKEKHIRSVGGRLFFMGRWPLDEYDEWPENVRENFKRYGRNDVRTLREAYRSLARALIESERVEWWRAEQVPYSTVLLNMECRGMPINLEDVKPLADEVRAERDKAALHLRKVARLPDSFNLNSPKQVREYLFSKWFTIPDRIPLTQEVLPSDQDFEIRTVGNKYITGVWTLRGRNLKPTDPPKRKDKEGDEGDPSTASPELLYKHPADPWVRELCLSFRRSDKLLGTYLDKFPRIAVGQGTNGRNGGPVAPGASPVGQPLPRIYGRFNQTGTVTGRLSSSEPNLQNIPARREVGKRVRALFQGRFVIGDYDALEMRLMAHFSRDPRLAAVFKEGGDPHALTARALFGVDVEHDSAERDIAKTVNYAIGYGAGARKLAQTLSLAGFATNFAVAKEYMALVEGFYPRLFAWKNRVIWRAKDVGFVTTIGGHKRHLQGNLKDVASWKQQSYGERQAVNSLIQGSAADILRRVMLHVDGYFEGWDLIAQIHDELLWEMTTQYSENIVRERLAWLQTACETGHGYDLRVPLSFVPVVCDTWAQKGTGIDLSTLTEEAE